MCKDVSFTLSLINEHACLKYTDHYQDWESLKATMPYGQLPVMDVTDEKTGEKQLFTQSPAMIRWVVQKFDKTGELLYFVWEV